MRKIHSRARLAAALNYAYLEGDDLHPSANIAAMSQGGRALNDAMRWPWLDAIAAAMTTQIAHGGRCRRKLLRVEKKAYRDRLSGHGPAIFLHLDLAPDQVRRRVASRPPHHFMPLSLADDQIRTLEPLAETELGYTLDATLAQDQLLKTAKMAILSGLWVSRPDEQTSLPLTTRR